MQDTATASALPQAGPGLGVLHVSATLERDMGEFRHREIRGGDAVGQSGFVRDTLSSIPNIRVGEGKEAKRRPGQEGKKAG